MTPPAAVTDFFTRCATSTSDGWRGHVGTEFNEASITRLAGAIGRWAALRRTESAVVGMDARAMSTDAARLIADTLTAHRIDVDLSAVPVPTPVLANAVRLGGHDLGIQVTASHNPACDNGVKLRLADGGSITTDDYKSIIAALSDAGDDGQGRVVPRRTVNMTEPYIAQVRSTIDSESIASLRQPVHVDSMHGVTGGLLAAILGDPAVRPHRADALVDFAGIVPDPSKDDLLELRAHVRDDPAALAGFAHDGDGDRLVVVHEHGNRLDAATVFAVIVGHLIENRGVVGSHLVRSSVTSRRVDDIADALGLDVLEVPVGVRHVAAAMRSASVVACCEDNGGMTFACHMPDRDGTLAGLLLLEALATASSPLSELVAAFDERLGPWHFRRADIRFGGDVHRVLERAETEASSGAWMGRPVSAIGRVDGVRVDFDDAWVALRPAGTEPLVRIYSEARTPAGAVEQLSRVESWFQTTRT